LVAIERGIKSKGFSKKAQVGILKKRHTQNYSSKFKKFNSWCNSMEIDPYLASLNEIADVLAFLFDEGLQYRTIADYSSMLSVLLSSVTTFPIGQHPHIIRLIKGVFNSKPLNVKFCKNGIYHLFKNAIKIST
jgi:hypothetical protein